MVTSFGGKNVNKGLDTDTERNYLPIYPAERNQLREMILLRLADAVPMRASYANANECFDISLTMLDKFGSMRVGYYRLNLESSRVLCSAIKERRVKQGLTNHSKKSPAMNGPSMCELHIESPFLHLSARSQIVIGSETTTKMTTLQSNCPDVDQAPAAHHHYHYHDGFISYRSCSNDSTKTK